MDQRVTLFSDPHDPQLLAQPFDGEGLPLGRQVWIENGVLKQLSYSRFWAQKQGKAADRRRRRRSRWSAATTSIERDDHSPRRAACS